MLPAICKDENSEIRKLKHIHKFLEYKIMKFLNKCLNAVIEKTKCHSIDSGDMKIRNNFHFFFSRKFVELEIIKMVFWWKKSFDRKRKLVGGFCRGGSSKMILNNKRRVNDWWTAGWALGESKRPEKAVSVVRELVECFWVFTNEKGKHFYCKLSLQIRLFSKELFLLLGRSI